MVRVVACILAHNEEKAIARVVIGAQRNVDSVIVCDDGSADMTGEIAERLGAEVLRHPRNLGYGASIGALFARARELGVECMVTLDGDGQHSPESIPRLVERLLGEGLDVVIGSRFLESEADVPRYRSSGIKALTSLTAKLGKVPLTDAQSGFRAYSRKALEAVVPSEMGMGVSTEILMKAVRSGLSIGEVPVAVSYGRFERSTHGPVFHFLDVAASTLKHYSIRHPLLFYGLPSLFFVVVGALFGLWAVQIYVAEGRLVTNLALIAVTSLITGLVLATTAVILFTIISLLRTER